MLEGSEARDAIEAKVVPAYRRLLDFYREEYLPAARTQIGASSLPGRAILQFNGTQAYMQGDEVVILQKDLPAKTMRYLSVL